jgi:hypothetical protein
MRSRAIHVLFIMDFLPAAFAAPETGQNQRSTHTLGYTPTEFTAL